jgi:hypothetical protein
MSEQTHKWLPSEPTDEMVEAANYAFANVQDMGELDFEDMKKVICAAIQAAPAVEQEPVGLFGCRDDEYRHILEPDDAGDYEELVELYTNPQPKD